MRPIPNINFVNSVNLNLSLEALLAFRSPWDRQVIGLGMIVYIGILRDIFENRRRLQDMKVYSRIFELLVQLVVRRKVVEMDGKGASLK